MKSRFQIIVLLRLVIFFLLSTTFTHVYSFDGVKNEVKPGKSIPFKSEHNAINGSSSTLTVLFVVLIIVGVALYVFSKKYQGKNWFILDKNVGNTIEVLQVRKITSNTIVFDVKVNGVNHVFLESSNTIKEIKSSSN